MSLWCSYASKNLMPSTSNTPWLEVMLSKQYFWWRIQCKLFVYFFRMWKWTLSLRAALRGRCQREDRVRCPLPVTRPGGGNPMQVCSPFFIISPTPASCSFWCHRRICFPPFPNLINHILAVSHCGPQSMISSSWILFYSLLSYSGLHRTLIILWNRSTMTHKRYQCRSLAEFFPG